MLKNPRLGFVCTKQTVDGQSGLEGYYYEYNHDLTSNERLRFARHEDAPNFDAALAPKLPTTDWPAVRLAKAHRNYAMEYMRSAYPVALQLWGPHAAASTLQMTGRLIGMQFYHQTAQGLGGRYGSSARGLACFMTDLARAQGDEANVEEVGSGAYRLVQTGWAFMDDISEAHPALNSAWNGLLVGALQAHNHRIKMTFSVKKQGPSPVLDRQEGRTGDLGPQPQGLVWRAVDKRGEPV